MADKVVDNDEEFKIPLKPPSKQESKYSHSLSPDIPGNTTPSTTTGTSTPIGVNATSIHPNSNNINTSTSHLNNITTGTKLDKAILSNLNKSLKAKQKIINSKEPLTKNSTVITEIVNRSPQSTAFLIQNPSSTTNPNTSTNDLENIPNLQLNDDKLKKLKKPSKQNSTRTDFFAAKLASAVDDVDSSDSDETFVYENNVNNDFNSNGDEAGQTIENNQNISTEINNVGSLNDTTNTSPKNTLGTNNNVSNDNNNDNNIYNASGDEASGQNDDNEHVDLIKTSTTETVDTKQSDDTDENNTTITNDQLVNNIIIPNNNDNNEERERPTSPPKILDTLKLDKDKFNPFPKNSSKQMINLNLNTSTNSNQFLDGLINKNLRPNNQRTLSTHSFESDKITPLKSIQGQLTESQPISQTSQTQSQGQYQNQSQIQNQTQGAIKAASKRSGSPYSTNLSSHGFSSYKASNISDSEFNSTDEDYDNHDADTEAHHTINDDNLDKSEDEIGDQSEGEVVDVDDVLSHDSYNSTKHTSNSTIPQRPKKQHQNSSNQPPSNLNLDAKHLDSNHSINSKSTKKKPTSTSKLRSTTSKLFDKKGSQPRRYSIIPDDIDIEDFDDELIYYDNNIRFPHGNNNGHNLGNSNTNSFNFSENSPLLNQPRIPHYRSLNLNPQKRLNKNKRYLSTSGATSSMGAPLPNSSQLSQQQNLQSSLNPQMQQPTQQNANNLNSDIFPFPYPEQQNQSHYYYGFDEYDEETGSINEHQFDKLSHKNSSRFNLNPNNQNHFFLPRKKLFVIDSNFHENNYNYIKRTIYTLISIFGILTIGFIMGFVIATTKDLTNVNIIDIQNTVVSEDELIFNAIIEALNPGWFTIGIEEVELDIFAKSGYLPDDPLLQTEGLSQEMNLENSIETVLLGSIYNFESPIYFQGGFFNNSLITQTGEIKLMQPGKNLTTLSNSTKHDNSEKWEIISKNPFDLIIRGILKYNLPITNNVKSVVVTKTSYIDPNSLTSKPKLQEIE